MNSEEFRRHGHEMIDWIADYLDNSERYPVMAQVEPGDITNLLPDGPPVQGQPMADIWADFQRDIMPGVTHWNHPRFFAYFPANNSGPSILGELLSAGLGVNAMLWQTCPAATELEEKVMQWLGGMVGLPAGFHGVIQDTASTASLTALVCAREKSTAFAVNRAGPDGLAGAGALRIYVSAEAHSSILKGARIAGFGAENVVRVGIVEDPTRGRMMDAEDLDLKIRGDLQDGLVPCCVVATVGTTGSTALDSLVDIGAVTQNQGIWLHVDAALAGNAAILPEMRWLFDGVEHADSLVFNPHKWMFTNFDCSAYYVRDPEHLVRSMSVNPEYLKTGRDSEVSNFMDWGVPLGRRFRALKLWFVLRHYGTERLQEMIRAHIALAREFARWVDEAPGWERLEPVPVNTVCFRWLPDGTSDPAAIDAANAELLARVNREGTIYLTHTKLDGVYTLRLAVGQRATRREHVARAWEVLKAAAAS